MDLDILQFIISTLRNYFPYGLKQVIVYNLPWILRQFWTVVKLWIGPNSNKLIKFANGEQIKQYIAEENLPPYLGGKSKRDFTWAPKICKPAVDLAHVHGFTPDDITKFLKVFQSHIEEARALVKDCNLPNDLEMYNNTNELKTSITKEAAHI